MQLRFAKDGEHRPPMPDAGQPDVHAWHTSDGAIIARGCHRDGWHWMHWPSLAVFRFSANDACITAFPDDLASRDLIVDTYRRGVLPMALQALGAEGLHASAIVAHGGVIAFAARSGTGKSTIAFGLGRRGFQQWADDGVVFRLEAGVPMAVPLPFDVRLRPEASILTELRGESPPAPGSGRWPQTTDGTLPVRAIYLLSQSSDLPDSAPVAVEALASATAFPQVLIHAHEFNPFHEGRRKRLLENYLALSASVPMFSVRFRSGPAHFAKVIDGILESVVFSSVAQSSPAVVP